MRKWWEWQEWQRRQVMTHPVIGSIVVGLLWGLAMGSFRALVGNPNVLVGYAVSLAVGLALVGPLSTWGVFRLERKKPRGKPLQTGSAPPETDRQGWVA